MILGSVWSASRFPYRLSVTRWAGVALQAIYGDMGFNKTGNAIETHHLLEQMMGEYDFVYHVGDISYADDWFHHDPNEFGYENVYNGYMNWMQPIVSAKVWCFLVPPSRPPRW
jgi:hypothetical protein